MLTKTTQPYEFLIRWTDGKISGAHIKFLETVSEDGVTLAQKETSAEPVELAIEVGFPMADVWAMVSAGAAQVGQQALTDIAGANAKKLEAEATEATALAAKEAATKAEAEAKAAADAAEKENARLAQALAVAEAAAKAAADKQAFDDAVAAAVREAA